jgi:hypothetical protein
MGDRCARRRWLAYALVAAALCALLTGATRSYRPVNGVFNGITTNPGNTWSAAPCAAAQLLTNPGFETALGTDWIAVNAIRTTTPVAAHGGTSYARLAGVHSRADTLRQTVTIPSGCNASFRFWMNIDTQEPPDDVYDRLDVQVLDSAGTTVLATWGLLSNLNATTGWQRSQPYDMSAFAGSTVRIQFATLTDAASITNFYLDDTTLDTSSPAVGCGTAQLITNSSFETTLNPWVGVNATTSNTGVSAHTGSWNAKIAGDYSSTDKLTYSVTIPSGCFASFRFWMNIDTEEPPADNWPYDRLNVEVFNSAGNTVQATWGSLSNLNATTGWVQSPRFDMSAFAGTTVKIRFTTVTDANSLTHFNIDDATLDTT